MKVSISNGRILCQRSKVTVTCESPSNRWFVYAFAKDGCFFNLGIVNGCGRDGSPAVETVDRLLVDYLLNSVRYNPSDIVSVRCSRNVHYRNVVEYK